MKTFPLLISSPDSELFRGEAQMLILRGTEGDLAVMAGHIPFVTAVVESRCVVVTDTEERKEGTIAGGVLTVSDRGATVLTSALTWDE